MIELLGGVLAGFLSYFSGKKESTAIRMFLFISLVLSLILILPFAYFMMTHQINPAPSGKDILLILLTDMLIAMGIALILTLVAVISSKFKKNNKSS